MATEWQILNKTNRSKVVLNQRWWQKWHHDHPMLQKVDRIFESLYDTWDNFLHSLFTYQIDIVLCGRWKCYPRIT